MSPPPIYLEALEDQELQQPDPVADDLHVDSNGTDEEDTRALLTLAQNDFMNEQETYGFADSQKCFV